jgi:hypothetical protein
MKNILLLIATLSVLSTKSQTSVYHPLPDSNACWNINLSQPMCFLGSSYEDYSITISGDTTINNHIWHKLTTPYVQFNITGSCSQQNFPGYQGAIRQDIFNKKVFYLPPAQLTEQLLYDFTMEVGDTVKGYLQFLSSSPDTVLVIDSVLIGNNYHKRWLINPCYEIYLIEGVGSTFGLLKPSPGCATDMDDYSLSCFSQDGQTLYPNPSSDCQLITSTNITDLFSGEIRVFPNPSNGSITIEFNHPFGISEVRINDMIGNIVLQNQVSNQNEVNLKNLSPGTYILTIISKEYIISKRIIISHPD